MVKQKNLFVQFDNENMTLTTSTVQFPDNKYSPIATVCGSDNIQKLVYKCDDEANKRCQVFIDELRTGAQEILIQNYRIASFEYKVDYEIKTYESPNKERLAIVIYHKNGLDKAWQDKIDKIHAIVCDYSGEIIWENDATPEFRETDSRIYDCCLDNNGLLFCPLRSFNKDNERITSQHLYLLQINEDGTEMNEVEEDFGFIANVMVRPAADGRIFLGGYYREQPDLRTGETGAFLLTFNPSSQAFSSVGQKKFGSNYFAPQPQINDGNAKNDRPWYQLSCDHLFELENGDIVLCGEQISRTITLSLDYGGFSFHTGNMVATLFHPNEEATIRIIPKNQSALSSFEPSNWRDVGISYHAFASRDNLYFVYNDAISNVPFPGHGDELQLSPWGSNPKCVSVCTRLGSDGGVRQQVLTTFASNKQLIRNLLFFDEQSLYVSLLPKKGVSIGKYPLP